MVRRAYALAIALAALACASRGGGFSSTPPAIQDFAMRARLERVAVGQSADQAHAILGSDPVQRPGHPENPFPSPRRAISIATPTGESLRIELYVVGARSAEGCPDVHIEDVPVVFRDGVVAARGWEAVESSWRGWGGTLAELRAVRDTYQCSDPQAASAR
ncbi:MAG TPA: hypothetical protein VKH41_07475 [Myxococcota bacterium]|nr:hypothetical protein [Myxococcota bacterium]